MNEVPQDIKRLIEEADEAGIDGYLFGDWILTKADSLNKPDAIQKREAEAWERGEISGFSVAMRRMSDEPLAPRTINPYPKEV